MLSPGIDPPNHSHSLDVSQSHVALRINIAAVTFWVIFVLVFCLSGVLTVVTHQIYRAALMSLLVAPLILYYGFRTNWVFVAYALLTLVVFASAIVNHSSIFQIIEFSRTLVFSYL